MKWLITAVGLALLLVSQVFAGEHSALARVTVYWHGEGSGANAAWNGAQLRDGHCAVDPKKIPYGSEIVFHDAECVAVDSGPDVVNRKAARSCGRSAAERNAIVIDRFFATRQKALAWAKVNPHFMLVQVRTPDACVLKLVRLTVSRAAHVRLNIWLIFFWKKTQRFSHDYYQNQTAPVQSSSGVRPGKEMSDVRTRERHAAFIRYRELPSIVTVEPDE